MDYQTFQKRIIDKATKEFFNCYNQSVGILMDPESFLSKESRNHQLEMHKIFCDIRKMYGPFDLSTSYDHVEFLRKQFVGNTTMVHDKMSNHAIWTSAIRLDAQSRLKHCLDDIDSFAWLLTEKTL